MDHKSVMLTRKRINELAISHNKLTTLVACLLNEINALKRELHDTRGSSSNPVKGSDMSGLNGNKNNKFPNFSELRAEEILKQLSINTTIDN